MKVRLVRRKRTDPGRVVSCVLRRAVSRAERDTQWTTWGRGAKGLGRTEDELLQRRVDIYTK